MSRRKSDEEELLELAQKLAEGKSSSVDWDRVRLESSDPNLVDRLERIAAVASAWAPPPPSCER